MAMEGQSGDFRTYSPLPDARSAQGRSAGLRLAIPGSGCYLCRMSARTDLKRLAAAVRDAEREFHAAKGRASLNAAIRRMMRAKAELKAAQAERSLASCVEAVEAAFSAAERNVITLQ